MVTLALVCLVAAADVPAVAGRVASAGGPLTREAAGAVVALKAGDSVFVGDIVRTGPRSTARLLMRDQGVLDLGPDTRLHLSAYAVQPEQRKRQVSMRLLIGRLWARVSKSLGTERDYEVTSANAVAGVRGTQFVVDVDPSGETEVTVVEGSVQVGTPAQPEGELLGPMQRATVNESSATVLVSSVTLDDVAVLETSVRPGATLDDAGSDQRLDTVAPQGAASGQAQERPAEPAPEAPPVEMPPIDLDPSSGRVRVRGQLEVRE